MTIVDDIVDDRDVAGEDDEDLVAEGDAGSEMGRITRSHGAGIPVDIRVDHSESALSSSGPH